MLQRFAIQANVPWHRHAGIHASSRYQLVLASWASSFTHLLARSHPQFVHHIAANQRYRARLVLIMINRAYKKPAALPPTSSNHFKYIYRRHPNTTIPIGSVSNSTPGQNANNPFLSSLRPAGRAAMIPEQFVRRMGYSRSRN